jgi:hypothetical protein
MFSTPLKSIGADFLMFNNLQQQTLKFQFSILNSQLPTDNCICYTRSIGSMVIGSRSVVEPFAEIVIFLPVVKLIVSGSFPIAFSVVLLRDRLFSVMV